MSCMGTSYIIYFPAFFILGLILIFLCGRDSEKNRVKKQTKIILITSLTRFILGATTNLILPLMSIIIFPLAIISMLIAMLGMFYAINKHRLMSITPEFVSEYIFKVLNEPIFILGEDFLIKNCNEACLELTGYNRIYLEQKNFSQIINSRNFNAHIIMKEGYVNNIEVDLHRGNKDSIVCELSGTIIYDEYKDILGIVILLHDVSKRKDVEEMHKKYNLELENKIIDRTSKLEHHISN